MPDFNLLPQIGDVDTSDPSHLYSCDEQFQVIYTIFGQGLVLPGGDGVLAVEKRKTEKGFSTKPGKVYTPNDGEHRQLLAGKWADIDKPYDGFLAIGTKAVLNAGRMVYLRQPKVLETHQSTNFKKKGERAAKGVIAAAGIDDYTHPFGIGTMELSEIGQWLAIFAGHERGQITTLTDGRLIDNPYLLFGKDVVERLRTFTNPKA
jgi:hypothetical protein